MDLFWKAAAGVLVTVLLGLTIGSRSKDMSTLLSMAACAMVCVLALTYLEPVLEFLQDLQALGDLQGDMLRLLLKSTGISLVAEIAAMICSDGGNSTLGKSLQMLGSACILCLSLPIFRSMLELIQKMLGAL